jgi:hypothetical protein
MENSKEGFAYPTASTADSEFAARAGNSNTACPLPVTGGLGGPYAPDLRCDEQDEGPPRGDAQLGEAVKGSRVESAADRASPAPAATLAGCEQQPAAAPPPTPGGHLHLESAMETVVVPKPDQLQGNSGGMAVVVAGGRDCRA